MGANRTPYALAGLNGHSHFERLLALSNTTEHPHSLWAGWIPDRDVSRGARKHVFYKVWSSVIHNSLKLKTTQMSTDGRREEGAAYRNKDECSRCTHYVHISKQCSVKEAIDKSMYCVVPFIEKTKTSESRSVVSEEVRMAVTFQGEGGAWKGTQASVLGYWWCSSRSGCWLYGGVQFLKVYWAVFFSVCVLLCILLWNNRKKLYIYTYIYIYIHTHTHTHTYIYTHALGSWHRAVILL